MPGFVYVILQCLPNKLSLQHFLQNYGLSRVVISRAQPLNLTIKMANHMVINCVPSHRCFYYGMRTNDNRAD